MLTGLDNKMLRGSQMSNKVKRLKLNHPWGGRPAGSCVTVKVDVNGTPLEKVWRKRLKDAEIDNNVEWADVAKKKPVQKPKKINGMED